MRKKLLAAGFIFLLFSLASAAANFVKPAQANPYMILIYDEPPIISIKSPLDNETFSSNDVILSFEISKPEHGWLVSGKVSSDPEIIFKSKLSSVGIVMDGESYCLVTVDSDLSSPFRYRVHLTNLEDGAHNLTIIAYCRGVEIEGHGFWERYLSYNGTSNLAFEVDGTSPSVSVLYPENDSYPSTRNLLDVSLDFVVNEPVSQLAYSLDGEANMTIAGNTTLAGLPFGEHNVTVYATDMVGHTGASETIFFTIEEPPEPFPTTMVIAPIASVAVVGTGLLVYFKKRKRRSI